MSKLSLALQKLEDRSQAVNSLVCVGLDTSLELIPNRFAQAQHPLFAFNRWIIDQTHDLVAAYKPNLAFYEARGSAGWLQLELTMQYLREKHPSIFTIADAKRADIGSTNQGYVTAIFDTLGFDAVTLHPYLGQEALQPFLDRKDKAHIILCRTSNPGAGELQDVISDGQPLWRRVAQLVSESWNTHSNCMLVVGATYPEELRQVREVVGTMPLLIPGIGAQGGDLHQVLTNGLSGDGGLLISSSRSIIYSDDPRESAQQLRDEIKMLK